MPCMIRFESVAGPRGDILLFGVSNLALVARKQPNRPNATSVGDLRRLHWQLEPAVAGVARATQHARARARAESQR
eukprot:8340790-Lingulodinium_polyedra.AAC.1